VKVPHIVAAAALLSFLVAPIASAHVTVTAEPPEGTIPADAPTSVPITLSASCATVAAEYEAAGKTELQLIAEGAPEFLTIVGDQIPFTLDMCDPAGPATVESTGNLVFTPGPLAPGLTPIMIKAKADGEAGEVFFNLTIAYRGSFTNASLDHFIIENGTATGELVFNVTTNANSLLMFSVLTPPAGGTLNLPETLDVESPIPLGNDTRQVTVPIAYTAAGPNATTDSVTVQVMLHAADDMSVPPYMAELVLDFEPAQVEEHDHDEHEHDEAAGVPGVEAVVLIGGIVAAACLARRRR
jgi:hypothetical protein